MKRACVYYIYKLIPNTLNQIIVTIVAERHIVVDISNKVIGTSLGQCIRDILCGDVKFTDVVMIYSGTNIQSEEDLEEVIESYSKGIWTSHDEVAIRLLIEYFLFRGLIQQERVGNNIYHGSYPNYKQLWYKLQDFDLSIQKAFVTVFRGSFDNSDPYDISDADKERNSSVKEELTTVIKANKELYNAKRRRYYND